MNEVNLRLVVWMKFIGAPEQYQGRAVCTFIVTATAIYLRLAVSQEAQLPGLPPIYDIPLNTITGVVGKRTLRLRPCCAYWIIITRHQAMPVHIRCRNKAEQKQLLLHILMRHRGEILRPVRPKSET